MHISYSSGSVNAELIDDVEGNLGTGRWIFDVGQSGQLTADLECYQWYKAQSAVSLSDNSTLNCPPYYELASLDGLFTKENVTETSERVCFLNVLPVEGPAIRCCYGKSLGASLVTALPLAGSVLAKNPLYFTTDDVYGYTKCCIESNRCNAYYRKRPIRTAEFYQAPHWGKCLAKIYTDR